MSDESSNPVSTIQDAAAYGEVAARAATTPLVKISEVETAIEELITAAAEARSREFETIGPGGVHNGEETQQLVDSATGAVWVPSGGGYVRTDTMEQIADPREPDASAYEWLAEEFRYFHERSPNAPQTIARHTQAARNALDSGQMSQLIPVGKATSRWGGKAAETFNDYFLAPFANHTVSRQQEAIEILTVTMHAYDELLKQARIDAVAVAEKAKAILDKMGVTTGWQTGSLILNVAVVTWDVINTVKSGPGIDAAEGLIGSAFDLAAAVNDASPQPKHPELAGATVDDVLDTVKQALTELRQLMDDEEQRLAEPVTNMTELVLGLLNSDTIDEVGAILPSEPDNRPGLTDGDNPSMDEFRPRS